MDNFIVSARKYRPVSFNSVVGQNALTTTLKNAIQSGRLASSYLFCGPRGVGKTTCARIFAKTINCVNPSPDGEACEQCESCKSFNEELRSYNVFELDAASNNSVDDIRTLTEQVRIPPMSGKYKVYIIDEVHMLSSSAFNAFLKTLEEPPKYAIFILATTEKHKIIPTILSRCQIYDFNRISNQDIIEHLKSVAAKENIEVEDEALSIIAEKSDGGMRDALSIFDQLVSFTDGHVTYTKTIDNLNVIDYNYYFRLTDYFLEHKISESLLLYNELLGKGFDGSHLISGLMLHFRNLLVSIDACTLPLLQVSDNMRERYQKQAANCSPKFLYKALKIFNNCDLNYRVSKNKRLLVELTLIQAAQSSDEDETSGQCPNKQLKPIFSKIEQVSNLAVKSDLQTASQKSIDNSATDNKKDNTTDKPTEKEPEKLSIPKISSDKLFVSIKGTSIRNNAQNDNTIDKGKVQEDKSEEKTSQTVKSLTEELLQFHWHEFATSLPRIDTPLANRMFNTIPIVTSEKSFKIVASNKMVADEFMNNKDRILAHLIKAFNNQNIEMEIEVDTKVEVTRLLNKVEQYQLMKDNNHTLKELEKIFGLELR